MCRSLLIYCCTTVLNASERFFKAILSGDTCLVFIGHHFAYSWKIMFSAWPSIICHLVYYIVNKFAVMKNVDDSHSKYFLFIYYWYDVSLYNFVGFCFFTGEAERIRKCRGRVFALRDEPEVARVWLPNNDSPGLAMARAFGDFCLKDFGLISEPDISYRRLTEKDEFIVLATDGVCRKPIIFIPFLHTSCFKMIGYLSLKKKIRKQRSLINLLKLLQNPTPSKSFALKTLEP